MSIKKEDKFDIEIEMHDKPMFLRKWKGRDVKSFNEVLENSFDIEMLTEEQLRTLVLPCVKDYEGEYLSNYDLLYMLTQIRKNTLGNNIKFDYLCPKCEENTKIDVDLAKCSNFEPDTFAKIVIGDITFNLQKDIKAEVLSAQEGKYLEDDATIIEMVLRVNSFEDADGIKNEYTFEEMFEYISDLDMSDYEQLLEEYVKQMSYFDITGTYQCQTEGCNKEHNLEFDVLPNFFGTL